MAPAITHRDFILDNEIRIVILRLIQLRENKKSNINSVKCEDRELGTIKGIEEINLRTLSKEDAKRFCEKIGYVPARRGYKCDVVVNGKRWGIRCLNYTDRALVNHSTRPKYEKVCKKLGLNIAELDDAVDKYISRRKLGIFNEDCFYQSEANPFIPHKVFLSKMLTYMAFNSFNFNKDTEDPQFITDSIDAILDFIDPAEESLWREYTPSNYLESIWTSLCFSLRDKKGMPDDSVLFLPEYDSVRRWNYPYKDPSGKIRNKAALHIRVKKYDAAKYGIAFEVQYQEEIKEIKQNVGERDEYLLKLFLIECRQKKVSIPIGDNMEIVRTVGTRTEEYGNLSFSLEWNTLEAEELISVCASVKATKAKLFDKADVYVNGIGISVKSERGGNPSLINHTTRDKIVRVMKSINQPILQLDKIVDRYWDMRLSKKINEDTCISDALCPFGTPNDKKSVAVIKPLLNYFAFDGTGTRDSASPAVLILSVESPTDVKTWQYFSKDNFVESVWNRLVFSIRGKSTPQFIDESREDHRLMLPWIREVDRMLKGALSVRVAPKKNK